MSIAEMIWTLLDSTFFQSIAVIISVYVAYRGVNAWQHQHVWTRNAELAEELLVAVAEFKAALKRVRNPVGFGGEGSTRRREDDETQARSNELDQLFTPIERLRKEQQAFDRLSAAETKSRLRFGDKISAPLDSLVEVRQKVVGAAITRFQRDRSEPHQQITEREIEQRQAREEVIWETPGSDPIGDNVEQAGTEIFNTLARYFRERGISRR